MASHFLIGWFVHRGDLLFSSMFGHSEKPVEEASSGDVDDQIGPQDPKVPPTRPVQQTHSL